MRGHVHLAKTPTHFAELQDVLTWPQRRRDEFLRSLVSRRHLEPLAQLIALALARLRLLRVLRDMTDGWPPVLAEPAYPVE
jgi:hypothetical protein